MSLVGCPCDHPVWDYFTYDTQSNKSLCQVEGEKGKIYGHMVSGKYTANVKNHLKKAYSSDFEELVSSQEKLKEKNRLRRLLLSVRRDVS